MAPTSVPMMNDTAQETTAVMAMLVEHEVPGASLLPVEGERKQSYSSFAQIFINTIQYNITTINNYSTRINNNKTSQ